MVTPSPWAPPPTTDSGLSPGLCGLYLDWGLLTPAHRLPSLSRKKEHKELSRHPGLQPQAKGLEPELPQASRVSGAQHPAP